MAARCLQRHARAPGRLHPQRPRRGAGSTGAGQRVPGRARERCPCLRALPRPPGPPSRDPSPPRDPSPTHLGAARGRAVGGQAGFGPWRASEPGSPQALSPPRRRGRERARREAAARAWPCPPRLRGGVGAAGRSPGPGGAAPAGRTRETRRPHDEQRARRGASSGSPGPFLGDARSGFEWWGVGGVCAATAARGASKMFA